MNQRENIVQSVKVTSQCHCTLLFSRNPFEKYFSCGKTLVLYKMISHVRTLQQETNRISDQQDILKQIQASRQQGRSRGSDERNSFDVSMSFLGKKRDDLK